MRRSMGVLVLAGLLVAGCSPGGSPAPTSPVHTPVDPPPPPPPPAVETTWNVDSLGVPRFVDADYIDLSHIRRISMFRSSVGHDYSDDFESCRSMKHYFQPIDSAAAVTAWIHSPVTGVVTRMFDEWAGSQVQIRSSVHPAFTFVVFHVHLAAPLAEGDSLHAGQALGTHIGDQTASDMAVWVETPTGRRLVSWFETLTDGVFAGYQARGIPDRASLSLTRAERDGDPLGCSGESFTTAGTLPQWRDLE